MDSSFIQSGLYNLFWGAGEMITYFFGLYAGIAIGYYWAVWNYERKGM